ncbi:MAG: thiamine phosphate synthase [Desulfobacterium sp.]|nr:thiamine phosphate synthase [Desulfobacterium sp.]
MKGIYLVTDSGLCREKTLEFTVTEALRAGVCCVQLREKNSTTRGFVETALRVKASMADVDVPLIINDRIDVALACGADGVHIGQDDMPAVLARKLLGPDKIIGLSVESWEDVEAAQELDVDYLGVSPVFPTPTKTDTKTVWGLEGLARIRAFSRHPLVAIGGLDAANARDVIRAGADSIAVVSAICGTADPYGAAQILCETVNFNLDKP